MLLGVSIPMQINIYNVAEEATKSLVRYIEKHYQEILFYSGFGQSKIKIF